MNKALIPPNELERIQALYAAEILDTGEEKEFNDIVTLAAQISEVPISMITFLDRHRQWAKAKFGIKEYSTSRTDSFCAHTILNNDKPLIVTNALEDERFKNNPGVQGKQPIIFYVGMPIVTQDGLALGSLCVIDSKPRQLNAHQLNALSTLANQVSILIELRLRNKLDKIKRRENLKTTNNITPYFLILDGNYEIIESGDYWRKSIPLFSNGRSFDYFFIWEKNDTDAIHPNIDTNLPYFFKNTEGTQRYQGFVLKDTDGIKIKLLVTPIINDVYPFSNYHLTENDLEKYPYFHTQIKVQKQAQQIEYPPISELLVLENQALQNSQNSLLQTNLLLEAKVKERTDRIAKLALFPLQNPSPVIELDIAQQQITYSNPAARSVVYKNRDFKYKQLLDVLKISHESLTNKSIRTNEFFFEGEYYEVNIYSVPGQNLVRLYLHNLTKIRLKEQSEKIKSQRIVRRQRSLLSMRNLPPEMDYHQKIETILKLTNHELNAFRSVFWEYNPKQHQLKSQSIQFQESHFKPISIIQLEYPHLSTFFEKLEKELIVLVDGKFEKDIYQQLKKQYLDGSQIQSAIFTPVIQTEQPNGYLSIEFSQVIDSFDAEDIAFAGSVADVIVLILDAEKIKSSQSELFQKNVELQDSLNKLVNMQEELIRQERMSTLGRLIAGIAHELNTPLGAISASTDNISFSIRQELAPITQHISSENISKGFLLFIHSPGGHLVYSTREERQMIKTLETALIEQSIHAADAMVFARRIWELGYNQLNEELLTLLQDQHANAILHIATILSRLEKSSLTIATATEKANRVVKALNNYSYENKHVKLDWFNLKESIESTIILFWNQIKHGVQLTNNVPEEVMIHGYAEGFSQVWTNILKNAIQAIGNKGKIFIDYQFDSSCHIIQFSNDGQDIPVEEREKIFDAFFTTKQRGEGTGLGLSIVKNIIIQHQGTIECQSKNGLTTFIITLPHQP